MKTIIEIETVDELLRFASRKWVHGDAEPHLPSEARIVFSNDYTVIHLEAEGFTIGNIKPEDVIAALCRQAGLHCHIT